MKEGLITHIKIPGTFIPERDLENKIRDLTKKHKTLHHEEPVHYEEPVEKQIDKSAYDLVIMAEKVAEKLGFAGGLGYYKFPGSYKFKTKLKIIGDFPHRPYFKETLKVYLKKGLFKKEKVLEFSKDYNGITKLDYTRGDWERDLKELYTLALIQ